MNIFILRDYHYGSQSLNTNLPETILQLVNWMCFYYCASIVIQCFTFSKNITGVSKSNSEIGVCINKRSRCDLGTWVPSHSLNQLISKSENRILKTPKIKRPKPQNIHVCSVIYQSEYQFVKSHWYKLFFNINISIESAKLFEAKKTRSRHDFEKKKAAMCNQTDIRGKKSYGQLTISFLSTTKHQN